jgi:hypothetical protein
MPEANQSLLRYVKAHSPKWLLYLLDTTTDRPQQEAHPTHPAQRQRQAAPTPETEHILVTLEAALA